MGTMRWRYCGHCGQTLFTDNEDKCDACEKTGPMMDAASAAALKDLKSRKMATGRSGGAGGQIGLLEVYRGAKLGCTGVFLMFLGFLLLTVPAFHDDPKGLTLKEALYGVLPILIGFGFIALAVVPLFLDGNGKSAEKKVPPPNQQT